MTWNNQNCAEKGAKITLLALYEKPYIRMKRMDFVSLEWPAKTPGYRKSLGMAEITKIHFFCNRVLSACNP